MLMSGKILKNLSTEAKSSRATASSKRFEMMTLTLPSASCKVRIAFSRLETPEKTSSRFPDSDVEVNSEAVSFSKPEERSKFQTLKQKKFYF